MALTTSRCRYCSGQGRHDPPAEVCADCHAVVCLRHVRWAGRWLCYQCERRPALAATNGGR